MIKKFRVHVFIFLAIMVASIIFIKHVQGWNIQDFEETSWKICNDWPIEYKQSYFCFKVYETKYSEHPAYIWQWLMWLVFHGR